MNSRFFTLIFLIPLLSLAVMGQNPIILTFTGVENGNPVSLSSVAIHNVQKNCDTTLTWPNMTLSLIPVGAEELLGSVDGLRVFPCSPNPVGERTFIKVYVPETGQVEIQVTNITGRNVASLSRELNRGYHTFLFQPGAGQLYLFTATMKSDRQSIKIAAPGNNGDGEILLHYHGTEAGETVVKSTTTTLGFTFSLGDTLDFTGYYNGLSRTLEDSPTTNETYTFDFTSGSDCPATVTYEGKTYNTVQIGNQCWFRENLNVGTRIDGSQNQTDNQVIEKYCYDNLESNCDVYGGLYQWDEAMQYVTTPGVKGICPAGWHLPADEGWSILTSYLGGESIAGGAMKETGTTHWAEPNLGATNSSGFTGLPGGVLDDNGGFYILTETAVLWSSSEYSSERGWFRSLTFDDIDVTRSNGKKVAGLSVRCVRDN